MRFFYAALYVFCLLAYNSLARAETVATKYLNIEVPDNWRVVMPPTENQTTSTVILSSASGTTSVGFVAGSSGGANAKTIAELFAGQFRAPRPPMEKNGLYVFTFMQQQTLCQAWVGVEGDAFLLTTILGDRKTGISFVKKHVKSEDYTSLLPK